MFGAWQAGQPVFGHTHFKGKRVGPSSSSSSHPAAQDHSSPPLSQGSPGTNFMVLRTEPLRTCSPGRPRTPQDLPGPAGLTAPQQEVLSPVFGAKTLLWRLLGCGDKGRSWEMRAGGGRSLCGPPDSDGSEVRAAVETPETMKIETIYSNKQAFHYLRNLTYQTANNHVP